MKLRKNARLLTVYTKLLSGDVLDKKAVATEYQVSEKAIQRDINDLRNFLSGQMAQNGVDNEIIFDRNLKGYRLRCGAEGFMSHSEILAVCKILLESRAFTKKELKPIMEKLLKNCILKSNRQVVSELIANEQYHYVEPAHGQGYIDSLWDIGSAIYEHYHLVIHYQRRDGKKVCRKLKPVGIMFSEYYFYLAAFIVDAEVQERMDNVDYPTTYRIDRIVSYEVIPERFAIPYKNRFEEGEFHKRIQFMTSGALLQIKLRVQSIAIEAVMDRLPTAILEKNNHDGAIIQAEVFGNGIEMWLLSQGVMIEVLEPPALREKMRTSLSAMQRLYEI